MGTGVGGQPDFTKKIGSNLLHWYPTQTRTSKQRAMGLHHSDAHSPRKGRESGRNEYHHRSTDGCVSDLRALMRRRTGSQCSSVGSSLAPCPCSGVARFALTLLDSPCYQVVRVESPSERYRRRRARRMPQPSPTPIADRRPPAGQCPR
jgi:hypothetical protein